MEQNVIKIWQKKCYIQDKLLDISIAFKLLKFLRECFGAIWNNLNEIEWMPNDVNSF